MVFGGLVAGTQAAALPVAVSKLPRQPPTVASGMRSVPFGGATDPRAPDQRRVLGGAAWAPRRYLQNVGDDAAAAPFRDWTKAGMTVRSGVTLTVRIAPRVQDKVRITWGGQEAVSLRFAPCSDGTKYNDYAGGFLTRVRAICVPLAFTVGRNTATLVFGIGRRC